MRLLPRTLRPLGFARRLRQGTLAALAPRAGLRLHLAPATIAFANTGDREPREWYLRAIRAAGVGTLGVGAPWLVLETAAADVERTTAEAGTAADAHAASPDGGTDGTNLDADT